MGPARRTTNMILIAALTLLIVLTALIRRVNLYSAILEGAWEGLRVAAKVTPCLVAMLCAVGVLRACGAMDALLALCAPLMRVLGLPEEVAPLFVLRPLTGSGSLGMLTDLMQAYGADSRVGMSACALMGSSETIFYTMSVYLGAAGVRKSRYALPAALLAWLAGAAVAGLVTRG